MDSVVSWVILAMLSCGGLVYCLIKAAEERARYKKENEEFFTHFNTSFR